MSEINLSNVNRLLTVLLLKTKERHGYEIMDRIEGVTGKRPSSSHIYPFLSTLVENSLVDERKDGRKKVYSLTEEGERFADEKVDSFGQIIEASVLQKVSECESCGCEIYSGGYEEEGKLYCCSHCATANNS
ncbi:PadR family transcriptional regulator [Candidatus Nanohalovita haloferacivicina]|uniref:PadR family transcriptional regulator n=1 Tax=Candidatus Nanohalovita haloferacivicina TaxID=2978046 RepID=UPI00325FCA77